MNLIFALICYDMDSGDDLKSLKVDDNINPHGDPFFLASSKHPDMQLVAKQFDGNNFSNWSRSIKTALGSKLKIGFIDGSCVKPAEGTANYYRWIKCDYMDLKFIDP